MVGSKEGSDRAEAIRALDRPPQLLQRGLDLAPARHGGGGGHDVPADGARKCYRGSTPVVRQRGGAGVDSRVYERPISDLLTTHQRLINDP